MEQVLRAGQMIGRRKRPAREALMPSAVLGMSLFVATEVMFFTALMSSYLVIKADIRGWAPPENVTLPVMATAFNTLVLMASGVLIVLADFKLRKGQADKAATLLSQAALLGAAGTAVVAVVGPSAGALSQVSSTVIALAQPGMLVSVHQSPLFVPES